MRGVRVLGILLAFSSFVPDGRGGEEVSEKQPPIGSIVAPAGEEKLQTAVVNIQELFRSYYTVERAQEEINLERARIQKEYNDLMDRLRGMDQSLRQLEGALQATDLTEHRRLALEREKGLRIHERENLNYDRISDIHVRHAELNRKMLARMDVLLREIHLLVAEQAEDLGFDLVFDLDGSGTSQVPMLLYVRDAADITPMILKELQKRVPPAG